MLKGAVVFVMAALAVMGCYAGERGSLPIYIEESHAGSFRGFTRMADLDEAHTLVLLDGHSDASAVEHSDAVREGIRRVRDAEERESRITEWRKDGRIQAYNWIETLMPRPVERVLWVAGDKLSKARKAELLQEAGDAIDGRAGFETRQEDEFARRWSVTDLEGFQSVQLDQGPLLATIDLDFFTGLSPEETRRQFLAVWEKLLTAPDLRGVTFAISRPWLKDDTEAFALLHLALNEVRLVRGAQVMFEPFAAGGRDDSLKAGELAKQGQAVPTVHLSEAPIELRRFLLLYGGNYRVSFEPERWKQLLETWKDEDEPVEIEHPLSLDGVRRVAVDALPDLRVRGGQTGRIRWWALRPAVECYNLLPQMNLAKGFTKDAAPWVRERRILLTETSDAALAAETWRKHLDQGWGRVRIEAEVDTPKGWMLTPPIEIRVREGVGFRAALSEQFGLPYIFGIGFAARGDVDGPDLGWGNDCANFLIYAWRQTGRLMPWGNPGQLRVRLRTLAEKVKPHDRTAIPVSEIDRGLVIDFGNHVAAVWRDLEPLGLLDPSDEVVHHLGGIPERTTLGKLCETRPTFAIRALPLESEIRVAIGGDLVLHGVEEADLERIKPPSADLLVANLEGIPSNAPIPGKRYNFAFPPNRLAWLAKAGIAAVSVANNHAGDAGVQELPSALERLGSQRIGVFGAGRNQNEATRCWNTELKGVKLAFLGVSAFPADSAESNSPGIASLPVHQEQIRQSIVSAKAEGRVVIVLIHWGREYTSQREESQIEWGRWLVDQGADAIVGAHPHVVQPLQFWRGRPVAFSLGNAVYPSSLRGADETGWLTLSMSPAHRVTGVELKKE